VQQFTVTAFLAGAAAVAGVMFLQGLMHGGRVFSHGRLIDLDGAIFRPRPEAWLLSYADRLAAMFCFIGAAAISLLPLVMRGDADSNARSSAAVLLFILVAAVSGRWIVIGKYRGTPEQQAPRLWIILSRRGNGR
jgi:hypothetical protein